MEAQLPPHRGGGGHLGGHLGARLPGQEVAFWPRLQSYFFKSLLLTLRRRSVPLGLMKTLLIFACLGLSIAGGHIWAIALNFHLPIFLSVIGAIATVSGGLLAGLIGAADEIDG